MEMNAEILLSELRNRGFEIYLDDYKCGNQTKRGIRVNPPGGLVSEFALKQVRKYKEDLICILSQEEELKKLVCLVCQEVFGITSLKEKELRICAALQCVNESLSYYTKLAMDYQLYKSGSL